MTEQRRRGPTWNRTALDRQQWMGIDEGVHPTVDGQGLSDTESEGPGPSSSAVDQQCIDPQSTCCQELGGAAQVFRRSPQLVDGHNWCLCCRQMGQSWRTWWTVCSASLQSQRAESMMPTRFRCARRPQCPVCSLNNSGLLMSCQTVDWVAWGLIQVLLCSTTALVMTPLHGG